MQKKSNMNGDKILCLKRRQKIFNYISTHPGLHIMNLSRNLNIPKTSLIYHLNYLSKLGLIKNSYKGKFNLFYAKNMIGKEEKELIKILRNKNFRRIYIYMNYFLVFSQEDICKEFNLSKSTVSKSINKLIELDLIEEAKVENGKVDPFQYDKENRKTLVLKHRVNEKGRKKFYIRKSKELTLKLEKSLYLYKDSIEDQELIRSYIDLLEEVKKQPKNRVLLGPKTAFNNTIDFFTDFFKPPFCA